MLTVKGAFERKLLRCMCQAAWPLATGCTRGGRRDNSERGVSQFELCRAGEMVIDSGSTQAADLCASYLKALGDPVRLQIVRALQAGPLSVTDIAEVLELELANVSHHLRVLFHAQLVTTQKEGKFSYYQLNADFLKGRAVIKSLDFGCCKIDLRD